MCVRRIAASTHRSVHLLLAVVRRPGVLLTFEANRLHVQFCRFRTVLAEPSVCCCPFSRRVMPNRWQWQTPVYESNRD